MLRARVAELEASASKPIPAPAAAPVPGEGKDLSGGLSKNKPESVSLPNADGGKAQAKAGGRVKWI